MKCEVMINARSTLIQSRLTTRYLELVHTIYTDPVDERLMCRFFFISQRRYLCNRPPLWNPPPLWGTSKGRKSHLRIKQLEMGAETYVKCFWVLTRKEKSKETVLLFSNLLPLILSISNTLYLEPLSISN